MDAKYFNIISLFNKHVTNVSLINIYIYINKLNPSHYRTYIIRTLLGSKILGIKCIRTTICNMLAKHDQNIESRFRLAQSVFICKIGIELLQNLLD